MPGNLTLINTLPVIAIIGAGIRGACLAAWLAAVGCAKVIVLEQRLPGSGISCSNHGRAHIGTWNYYRNPRAVIERDLASYELNRRIPGIWESAKPGLYCIESPDNIAQFLNFCENYNIPIRPGAASDVQSWIDIARYTAFEIPEYSFNPARLAARCVRFAQTTGRCDVNYAGARTLTRDGDKFVITTSDGRTVHADIVVNAMGGWMNCLRTTERTWKPKMLFNCWRLLCVHAGSIGMPQLDRVITIDRTRGVDATAPGPVAAVPHGGWVALGCDIKARRVKSQDEIPPGQGWRTFDPGNEMDQELYAAHKDHFPALARLVKNAHHGSIYSMPGVYPEIASGRAAARSKTGIPTPYLAKPVWEDKRVPGYYVLFGGSATTALLDARDAAAALGVACKGSEPNLNEPFERIVAELPDAPEVGMVWDGYQGGVAKLARAV